MAPGEPAGAAGIAAAVLFLFLSRDAGDGESDAGRVRREPAPFTWRFA